MARQHYGRELWDRMCDFVAQPDGLIEYECGTWTIQKLFFLCHYLGVTTQAMVGHPQFDSINYIDLFAGAGVCVTNESRTRRYPGSALIAAGCQKHFSNLYLVEQDKARLEALKSRIERLRSPTVIHTFNEDANDVASAVAGSLPGRSLNIAFIDPYSLDIRFDSIQVLASGRPLDLIILFADRMDVQRNVDEYYYPQKSDKLDLFLGPASNWRIDYDNLLNRDGGRIREMFASIYLRQLRTLGYMHTRTKSIEGDNGALYRLVYASKNSLGLKFWDVAESEGLGGERSLFGV